MSKLIYFTGDDICVRQFRTQMYACHASVVQLGYELLTPAHLACRLTPEQYAALAFPMLGVADAAIFPEGWERSQICKSEMAYCITAGKDFVIVDDAGGGYDVAARLARNLIEREAKRA